MNNATRYGGVRSVSFAQSANPNPESVAAREGAYGELAALFMLLSSSLKPEIQSVAGLVLDQMERIRNGTNEVRRMNEAELKEALRIADLEQGADPSPGNPLDLYFQLHAHYAEVCRLFRQSTSSRQAIRDHTLPLARAARSLAFTAQALADADAETASDNNRAEAAAS